MRFLHAIIRSWPDPIRRSVFFGIVFRPCPYARFSKPPVPDSNRDDAVDRGQNWLRAMFK